MLIYNKNFLVAGVSKSGFSACKHILENNGNCYFYEELSNDKIVKIIESLEKIGGKRVDYKYIEENISMFDMLILSPGVPINHKLPILFKKNNRQITGEFDFAVRNLMPKSVAVTGTNGKTTTVSLIDEILKNAKLDSQLVGNIGIPISSKLNEINNKSIIVSEISSFQLETISLFAPNITCILNITPDHLDRHYTMENYVFLKKKILQNIKVNDYVILNFDDEVVKNFADNLNCNKIFVSLKDKKDCYLDNGNLVYRGEIITNINSTYLKGQHNIYNMLFAIAVCKILGIDSGTIEQSLISFKGVKHRIEFVKEINGISFYNDSKSTNSSSTINAIDSILKPINLILGGSDKEENFDELFKKIKENNIKHIILTGETKQKMLSCAIDNEYYDVSVIADFENAVRFAYKISDSGDVVLLSPACASFDCFQNFEERGDEFSNIVEKIENER